MPSEDVRWSDLACFVGRSSHIPAALADLSSPDEQVRLKAFRLLLQDLAWNENVFEATPYAICDVVERLERRDVPHPNEAFALLRTLGNGEAAHPELINWHGRTVDLLSLCRERVESSLTLYLSYLSDPGARLGALDVISGFRGRRAEALAELGRAADSATSTEERTEILTAIGDLREWNDTVADEPSCVVPDEFLTRKASESRAAMIRIGRGERPPRRGNAGPLLSARQYLIRLVMRFRERSN
ncbi:MULTISPECIES: hypothetical protein [Micromonospora]|uniref:hypothetical protein n=1 Tax=Micromonospora TaxID=1873 RepID=UPI000F5EA95E|nr:MULTISPECIES: hypothetical protein [Micromonospora]